MIDRTQEFDVIGEPHIDITTVSGDVTLEESDDQRVMITLSGNAELVESTTIDRTGDTIIVRSDGTGLRRRLFGRALDVVVTMPPGAIAHISSTRGDIRVAVRLAQLDIRLGSGDVRIEEPVGEARVKVASGDVSVGEAHGDLSVSTANGDIDVGHVTDAIMNTASGRIVVGVVEGVTRLKTARGDVRVWDFRQGDLEIATLSGDVSVGLAPGRLVEASLRTLSGIVTNKIKPTAGERKDSMSLSVHTYAGDITLKRAKAHRSQR